MRGGRTLAALAAAGALATTVAHAQTPAIPGRTVLATNDGALSVTDDPGTVSALIIETGEEGRVRVTNTAGPLLTRPGALDCVPEGGSTVDCPTQDLEQVILQSGDGDDSVKIVTRDDRRLPNVLAYLEDGNDTFESDTPNGLTRTNVKGGPGNDQLTGGAGLDMLSGGDGDDRVIGNLGRDLLYGGTGNDYVRGATDCTEDCEAEPDNDFVNGGPGDDDLAAGAGRDKTMAGSGDDVIHGEDDGDIDQVNGMSGEDRLRGVDFNRRTYLFKDQLVRLERIFATPSTRRGGWTCKGPRCTVRVSGRKKLLRVRLY